MGQWQPGMGAPLVQQFEDWFKLLNWLWGAVTGLLFTAAGLNVLVSLLGLFRSKGSELSTATDKTPLFAPVSFWVSAGPAVTPSASTFESSVSSKDLSSQRAIPGFSAMIRTTIELMKNMDVVFMMHPALFEHA
jgi:hypothetical protein